MWWQDKSAATAATYDQLASMELAVMKRQIKQMLLLCEATAQAQPSSPVLDVSFPAAKARRVDGERDGLEPSPFSSPHQLLHHLPVLVDLYTKNIHGNDVRARMHGH